ncbi:MAG TPA: hypothetical protein VHF88_07675 [Thermoleophilaceae bacterium]|nr:hypothetical protein [Thermoleophilaceae bacterium]
MAIAIAVAFTGESCRKALARGEACGDLGQFVYDGAQTVIVVVLLVVALAGGAILNALQRAIDV